MPFSIVLAKYILTVILIISVDHVAIGLAFSAKFGQKAVFWKSDFQIKSLESTNVLERWNVHTM